jgi:hypothetical protein
MIKKTRKRHRLYGAMTKSRPFIKGLAVCSVLLLAAVAAWLLPPAARADIDSGLVGQWKLNEGSGLTAADSSGNGNDGTIVQTGSSPAWVSPGHDGSSTFALEFDGAGTQGAAANTVSIGDSADLDQIDNYTMSVWVKFEPGYVGNGGTWANLMGRTAGTDWAYMLYVNNQGHIRPHHKNANGTFAPLTNSATVMPVGEWVHIQQVADNGNLRLYINGVEDSNFPVAYNGTYSIPGGANTYIGQDTREFTPLATISEASIYNAPPVAPGGVYDGIEYWLRSEEMVLSGGTVSQWDDVYGWHTDYTFVGGSDIVLGDGFNFHDTARFNNGYLSFNRQLLSGATAGEMFSMVQTLRDPSVTSGYPYEFGGGGSDAGWAYQYPPAATPRTITGTGSTTRKIWNPGSPVSGPVRDMRDPLIFNELSAPGNYTARLNGLINYTDATNTVNFDSSNSGQTYIGASHNSRFVDGNLSEVIAYRKELTTAERERVQSYMATKYGMTLGTTTTPLDYKASDESVFWTGSATYQNDIAGIGRDDTSLLNQKQSKSENPGAFVTMGNGTIAVDNDSNPNDFADDKTFMLWGDDAGSTDVVNDVVEVSGTQLKRMERIWDIQETGTIGTVKLQIPQTELAGTTPMLLVSDDETFDSTDQQIALTANDANYEADVNFTGDQFFTFGVAMIEPDVTTDAATNITGDSATLNGTLDSVGDFAEADVFFRYRIVGSGSPFTETTPQQLTAAGAFDANISGLTSNTEYEFKTVVQWQAGGTQEKEGSLQAFETAPVPPDAPINLQAAAAGISQIDLTWEAPVDEGGGPITGYQIERSLTGVDGWTTIVADTGNTNTTYEDTGLTSNTEYFYRVSAINADGTGAASNVASAMTDKLAPQVSTDPATDVTDTTTTLEGTLNIGDFAEADVFFRYRVQGSLDPFTQTPPQQLSANGAFSQIIANLDPETTYEFQAVAQWDNGGTQEVTGSLATFTTLASSNAPECAENNVDCFTNPVTGTEVILETDDACSISEAQITAEADQTAPDPGFTYPLGLMNFSIDCGTPGYTTTITQYYLGETNHDFVLRKHIPADNNYFTIADYTLEQAEIDGRGALKVTYQATDGGDLDIDGEVNGIIVDPAGLAQQTGNLADTGENMWPFAIVAISLIGGGLVIVFRRAMITE